MRLGSEDNDMSSKWVMSSSSSPGRLEERREDDLTEERELLSSGGEPGEMISIAISESEEVEDEMEQLVDTVSERVCCGRVGTESERLRLNE